MKNVRFDVSSSLELWDAIVAWWWKKEGGISGLKAMMRKVCLHKNVETDDYLNPCSMAACKQHGVCTYHLGCGSQHKDYCADCGAVLYDSAKEEIKSAEWEEIKYSCQQCIAEGIQPGHKYCGQTFCVPR